MLRTSCEKQIQDLSVSLQELKDNHEKQIQELRKQLKASHEEQIQELKKQLKINHEEQIQEMRKQRRLIVGLQSENGAKDSNDKV